MPYTWHIFECTMWSSAGPKFVLRYRGCFRVAAHRLVHNHVNLASPFSTDVKLQQRIEYLSRAVMCSKSSSLRTSSASEGEFLHEIEEKLEVWIISFSHWVAICFFCVCVYVCVGTWLITVSGNVKYSLFIKRQTRYKSKNDVRRMRFGFAYVALTWILRSRRP